MGHHQWEELGKGQKETPRVRPPPRILLAGIHLGWAMWWVCHQEGLWESLAKDNPETNPITIKPKTASHVTELFSWVPLPYCSPPGCPFPIKSLALSARVSPWTIHFRVLNKSPSSGPGRGPTSCNRVLKRRQFPSIFFLSSPHFLQLAWPWEKNGMDRWNHLRPSLASFLLFSFFFFFFFYIFIWLHRVLIAACKIFSCGNANVYFPHANSQFVDQGWTWAPCIGSTES